MISEAESVLCVGGGPTGIESACYIKETYPDKHVGICQSGPTLLPKLYGAHQIA